MSYGSNGHGLPPSTASPLVSWVKSLAGWARTGVTKRSKRPAPQFLKRRAPISEITRRDAAKRFGGDLSGEQNVLELVRRFFPIDTLSADFFAGRSLASDIERHMISNFECGRLLVVVPAPGLYDDLGLRA